MMDFPITLPAQNPWRTSWNSTPFLICVSIMASITFQRTPNIPIHWVSLLPLGVRIKIFHSRYTGIIPCSHMNYTRSTSFIHFYAFWGGGGGECLLFHLRLPQPHIEVFGPQVHVAPFPIHLQAAECRLHFCLHQYLVINLKWDNMGGNWYTWKVQVLPLV